MIEIFCEFRISKNENRSKVKKRDSIKRSRAFEYHWWSWASLYKVRTFQIQIFIVLLSPFFFLNPFFHVSQFHIFIFLLTTHFFFSLMWVIYSGVKGSSPFFVIPLFLTESFPICSVCYLCFPKHGNLISSARDSRRTDDDSHSRDHSNL